MTETAQLPAEAAGGPVASGAGLTTDSEPTRTAAQVAAMDWDDDRIELRVYYPDLDKAVKEYRWQGPSEWTEGATFEGSSINSRAAAVHWRQDENSHLRVYYQQDATNLIIEKCYDTPDWADGQIFPGALPGTGIAALALFNPKKESIHLMLYYQTANNQLVEQYWDGDTGIGWVPIHAFQGVSPGSGIAAVYFLDESSNPHKRVYYQDPSGLIVEQCWDGDQWALGHTFTGAIAGTGIAATHLWDSSNGSSHIRLYYQDTSSTIVEQVYDTNESWRKGHSFSNVTTGTGIAAVWWHSPSGSHIRVYYEDTNSNLIEQRYDDGTWTTGDFSVPAN